MTSQLKLPHQAAPVSRASGATAGAAAKDGGMAPCAWYDDVWDVVKPTIPGLAGLI